MSRRWTESDIARLKDMLAAKRPRADICAALDRSRNAIRSMTHELKPVGDRRRKVSSGRYTSLFLPKDEPGLAGERPFKDNFSRTERRWAEAFAAAGGRYA